MLNIKQIRDMGNFKNAQEMLSSDAYMAAQEIVNIDLTFDQINDVFEYVVNAQAQTTEEITEAIKAVISQWD